MRPPMLAGMIRLLALLLFLALGIAPAAAAPLCTAGGAGQTVTLTEGGRGLAVFRPAALADGARAPLVLLLHGSGATGAEMLRDSRLAEAAARHGFRVVAPDAGIRHERGYVWNIPGVPTVSGRVPGPGDPDDVAFLTGLIDRMVGEGCVDRTRVYATGLSGGGRMTSWLGCVAADRFAAIAPVVGLRAGRPLATDPQRPDPATCRPARPMPVIAFAGDRDTTNPIAGGGASYWQYSMHAAERRWAALNGCTAVPVTERVAPNAYEERYDRCRGDASVTGRIVEGAGHSWVADNDVMWAFLRRHRR
ncbi:poly(3-hydroxyalkanoate) depolymerase [Sphingomonas metalli]|uniref:Poly(3-hydroxyalkanoate) depolymerase n=1 Tax=Sphingomonas metalli TaxID=1779358 RepID=A0A916T2L4_9SPHN|nr:poly(3-hydroxyalkanoate) depolymerase [Sphingomonas metalli]